MCILYNVQFIYPNDSREVTRAKSKRALSAVIEHQRMFTAYKTTSNVKWHFKSSAAPLHCSFSDFPVMCSTSMVVVMFVF